MYMEDFTEMLKQEMDSLDDVSSEQGQALRRELGIEGLEGKELLKYKIDFLAKHMGHSDLHCIEKSDYFQELIKGCIDMKKAQEFFNLAKITCIEENSSMRILCVLTDKEDNSKTIYSISDGEEIMQASVDELKQQFESGMKTLSKSREAEFKELLFGGTEKQEYYRHSPISDIESIMVNGLNPDLAEADLRTETSDERKKVFYSEGKEGVVTFDCTCRRKYRQWQEQGRAPEEMSMDEYYQERDGEDRIYIKFEADNIVNEQDDNIDRFADACTSRNIPAQNIKVCVLKNNSTGNITYRREDIVTYMMSACPIEDIKSKYLLDDRLSNQLEEYYKDRQTEVMDLTEYTLEEMELQQFYEQYIAMTKNKIFTQEEIGKATVNVPTTQKDKSKREIQRDERALSELQNVKQQE